MSDEALKEREHEELVEALKGPHHYRVQINGYGGEMIFMKVSKEAKDFWENTTKHGDRDLVLYCTNADSYTIEEMKNPENVEWNELDPNTLTQEVCFLHDVEGDVGQSYYENSCEVFHNFNAELHGSHISVSKLDSPEIYEASITEDVIDYELTEDFIGRIGTDSDWTIEAQTDISKLHDYSTDEPRKSEQFKKGDCVIQFYSSEKGCFFDTVLTTPTLFNEKKLQVVIDEDAGGNDCVWGLVYDDKEVENDAGGDTTGKGYYAWAWEQVY